MEARINSTDICLMMCSAPRLTPTGAEARAFREETAAFRAQTAAQFAQLNARFDRLELRLGRLDERLGHLDDEVGRIARRLFGEDGNDS